ncbi:hypothetical protein BH11VER1_BH11VER1_04640 [soil metagenome]
MSACSKLFTAILLLTFGLTSCRDKEEKSKLSVKKPKPAVMEAPHNPSADVERFTGAHTRLVWSETNKEGGFDSFSLGERLTLKGIDTRDGRGERLVLDVLGNYSRPLMTSDGEAILYTDKNTKYKNNKKYYKPVIYRTDWKGSAPKKLAEGYATTCWNDPATGTEWVYAVTHFKSSRALQMEGENLVRFPLNDPGKVEVVYDDTPVTPDNIQLSRDGTRASGLFPWPNGGIFHITNGKWTAQKLLNGCWTAHSPDNSGLFWVFNGDHNGVAMFAEDGAKTWEVRFNHHEGLIGKELYHPRWSNHPRFLTFTGPYVKQEKAKGSIINNSASVPHLYLAKLNEKADKLESWMQVTQGKLSESYPDVWIAGANKVDLAGFSIPKLDPAAIANEWPGSREGLLFVWRDRQTLNSFQTREGKKMESIVESQGAGRFGRHQEMLLDGGTFIMEEDDESAPVLKHLNGPPTSSVSMMVLPSPYEGQGGGEGPGFLIRGPNLNASVDANQLVLTSTSGSYQSAAPLPADPFHLAILRKTDGFDAFVNGQKIVLVSSASAAPIESTDTLIFGGNWNGGLRQIVIYDHLLNDAEVQLDAQSAMRLIAKLAPAPARIKLRAKLTEASGMPTAEGIDPYTSSLVVYIYDVEKVLEGDFTEKRILVKHWAMLGQKPVDAMPREVGKSYDLMLERESGHPNLKGERVMDDTAAFDMEPWFEVASPRVTTAK